MLPIRSSGDRTPLFCIHPASGLSWSYSLLLRHLPRDRPVYGVQARGFTDDDPVPSTMADVAADYVDRIRQVQPHGPYHLLGWSFGGEIAYAIATFMQRRGHVVALLALIDAGPRRLAPASIRAAQSEPRPASPFVLSPFLREFGLAPETQARIQRVTEHTNRLRDTFEPEPFDGDLVFFMPARRDDQSGPADADAMRAIWAPLVRGEVRVYPVAASHTELMSTPAAAAQIGPLLATELDRASTATAVAI
jgi:thioesterase domain-containing protein